ncbi:isoleucine--tRNA ligase, cytoplasmic [Agrilus planipennis]|uniref:Isoleucine--tRNA ligase, cytoplasmic n=1 Tax=Agrilus planipennis TaxID=224129 RepID=A0A1W4WV87_AGRPL|nr:isoleucine--tRNA ligase, cytoplasmic [Agrilus planipennis]
MTDENVQEIPRISETVDFPLEEEKVLKLWQKINAFQNSLKQSKGKPRYSFYDGPPFATGLPHYGHVLAGTIKDIVTRYACQQGYHVERRFGWDCHGLPVEFEIDKTLNIKGPEDVEKLGIDKYNAECRKIVTRYVREWEIITERLGRWIDFKNDYKTLYPWYMESIWWIFKQLYLKGLVYQGNKVMPFSTACNTPLSNFESGQNYKDVVDPALTVSLPIIGDKEGAALLIWTTTPWTLPSNLSACVNANLEYAKFKDLTSGNIYIMLESRIETIFKPETYQILQKFNGITLKGLRYEPPFPYFKFMQEKGAFQVFVDDYVTADSGTGVVHQAPYFGEDDYRVCLINGVITKDMSPLCPVDANGRLTKPVTDFEGQYIKDADKNIIAMLKANNRLVHLSQIKHSYPFCWRSDTPLIYKAVPSWFIRVETIKESLLTSSNSTYWVPDFVKEKRFGNWLRDARDWAVSRNRYWGTPIPIWKSPSGDEVRCIGSIAELEELTGTKVTDLHRESIDHLTIPSAKPGNPPLQRVPEVFDCWFESGSMPYAQQHYPFENNKEFEECFPADFVAEGIDQTRGWFYTLIVISSALFGKAPFKNLIVNGLVLASDGQKMSKRKKNYPDPMEVVNKYGADALRLYLINSPVVRAENLRFKEEGIRDVVKDVFLPWYNAFRFLMQNLDIYVQENKTHFIYNENDLSSDNIMDRWIISFTQSLLEYVRKEMALYHLYNVVPRLTKFIDHLTNWYVRMNRKRLKGEGGQEDCKRALTTLFNVLFNMVKMMAPFTPFLSETMYQYLKKIARSIPDSVHYLPLPEPNISLIHKDTERAISGMQEVIELARVMRDRRTIPVKYPLPELVVVHRDEEYIKDVLSLQEYVLSEVNVRKLTTTTDKSKYGVTLRAEPDHKTLGLRLKQDFKAVTIAIKALQDTEINKIQQEGFGIIAGHRIELSELRLIFKADSDKFSNYEVASANQVVVLLDTTPDKSMQDEGTAREIINRIQKLRKKAQLVPTDEIKVFYKVDGDLSRIAESHKNFIENSIKAPFVPLDQRDPKLKLIIEENQKLKDGELYLLLTGDKSTLKSVQDNGYGTETPVCKWINVYLQDFEPRYGNGSRKGLILLEVLGRTLSLEQLKAAVNVLFGLYQDFELWTQNGKIETDDQIPKLSEQTVFVLRTSNIAKQIDKNLINTRPFCKVRNFTENGIKGTIILENPAGHNLSEKHYKTLLNKWLSHN